MTQTAVLDEETVGFETVRIGPDVRVSVDRPYVHEHDRVFGDVEAGWKRSKFCLYPPTDYTTTKHLCTKGLTIDTVKIKRQ